MRPYRRERVANTIRDIVSDVVAHKLQDPRVDAMTTITRVVMSGDLLIANVYITVHGGGASERRTLTAIQHAGGYIQRVVAGNLTMRQCPELRFRIDEAVEGVRKTMELLAENRRQRSAREETTGEQDAPGADVPKDEGGADAALC